MPTPEENAAHIHAESVILLDTETLVKQLMAHCESACRVANHAALNRNDADSRHWSDRAQNLRRVLVDYGALPTSSL